jgi:hypothetical protein
MKLVKGSLGWVIVTVLATFSMLTWLFWDFIRDVIVVPIYYLIWLVGLILNSIPQVIFLILLVFVCFMITLNTLFKIWSGQYRRAASRYRTIEGGRYLFWNRLLTNLRSNPFSRDNFALEARKLILSILSYQEGIDIPGIEQILADHKISVPVSVAQLVISKKLPFLPEKGNPHGRKLPKFLHRFFQKDAQDEPMMDEQAKEIIHFIEDRLEISHDKQ